MKQTARITFNGLRKSNIFPQKFRCVWKIKEEFFSVYLNLKPFPPNSLMGTSQNIEFELLSSLIVPAGTEITIHDGVNLIGEGIVMS